MIRSRNVSNKVASNWYIHLFRNLLFSSSTLFIYSRNKQKDYCLVESLLQNYFLFISFPNGKAIPCNNKNSSFGFYKRNWLKISGTGLKIWLLISFSVIICIFFVVFWFLYCALSFVGLKQLLLVSSYVRSVCIPAKIRRKMHTTKTYELFGTVAYRIVNYQDRFV